MKWDEILALCKSYIKKQFSIATISTVDVNPVLSGGEKLAEIDVSGTKSDIYMPAVKINGVEQSIDTTNNEIDLDVATNLITEDQWTAIQSLLT